ncbi:MAG: ADP-ribosylglycohydrolase family protein [Myxococcales bacterium]|nr:ADP-ribosylglycohydrolase family protein [Myxococcales bacterium]
MTTAKASLFDIAPEDRARSRPLSPLGLARLSLEGLSIGDAFGERFFGSPATALSLIEQRAMPREPWHWTDDTAMALSIYEVLLDRGLIDRGALARRFGERYRADPRRGYGGAAHDILAKLADGAPWNEVAREPFDGQGSMGNGGAMRSALVGGFFSKDLGAVVENARASAEPTHAHPEGQAGAIAVALAAALAARRGDGEAFAAAQFFAQIAERTPAGATRDGIEQARGVSLSESPESAAALLGSGSRVISSDTVPFSLWCAARHMDDFEAALWSTVSGLGDRDTTCAIVGGIVALSVGYKGIPEAFSKAREPLDSKATHIERHAQRG